MATEIGHYHSLYGTVIIVVALSIALSVMYSKSINIESVSFIQCHQCAVKSNWWFHYDTCMDISHGGSVNAILIWKSMYQHLIMIVRTEWRKTDKIRPISKIFNCSNWWCDSSAKTSSVGQNEGGKLKRRLGWSLHISCVIMLKQPQLVKPWHLQDAQVENLQSTDSKRHLRIRVLDTICKAD